MKNMIAVILAAGKGTRMRSRIPKVLHKLLGKSVIFHILDSVASAGIKNIVIVAGHGSEALKAALKGRNVRIVIQKKLMGSGDAVSSASSVLEKHSGDTLILCGDTPLISDTTITGLVKKHRSSNASATILTAEVKNPTGYGRIARQDGRIVRIVEELEASLYDKVINEINSGSYCFKTPDIIEALREVRAGNKKKEYFLTDTINILHKKNKIIESLMADDADEIAGINTRCDLAEATMILKMRILKSLMLSGVTVQDPASTTIYPGVRIGRDSIIYPNTIIESDVRIGSSCHIGPFARLREGVSIEDNVEIGNFVELVRANVSSGTRIKHHTYLGDTIVGRNVNIGAGTITANFDGVKKSMTIIEDGAFIGVGSILIAPLKIGKGATVGAGAVVPKNKNVPQNATVVGVPARLFKK